jgi:DNA-binding YbaB/EbfC family protein
MFGKIKELGSLMKQAQEMRDKFGDVTEELRQIHVQGIAAGGLVIAEMNGAQELLKCKIDTVLFKEKDAELLEELLVDAVNDALAASRDRQMETMKSITEGFNVRGLSEAIVEVINKEP